MEKQDGVYRRRLLSPTSRSRSREFSAHSSRIVDPARPGMKRPRARPGRANIRCGISDAEAATCVKSSACPPTLALRLHAARHFLRAARHLLWKTVRRVARRRLETAEPPAAGPRPALARPPASACWRDAAERPVLLPRRDCLTAPVRPARPEAVDGLLQDDCRRGSNSGHCRESRRVGTPEIPATAAWSAAAVLRVSRAPAHDAPKNLGVRTTAGRDSNGPSRVQPKT